MLDARLFRVHRPGGLPFALDQGIELRLQRLHVVLDLAEPAMRTRRPLMQLRERRPVERNPSSELLAARALALDLMAGRLHALVLLTQSFGELLAALPQ